MSDKTNDILEILDKLEFFQGQRAGRQLWADKTEEVQNEDIANFNRDIQEIKEYVLNTRKPIERIMELLEECYDKRHEGYMISRDLIDLGRKYGLEEAIDVVREEGGLND